MLRKMATTVALFLVGAALSPTAGAQASDLRVGALPAGMDQSAAALAPACSGEGVGPAFGTAAVSGSVGGDEVTCHPLTGVVMDDVIAVRAMASGGGGRHWRVVDGSGTTLCDGYWGLQCRLTSAGPWTIQVLGDGGAFTYFLNARRLTDPQGCSPLGEPDALSFAAPRVDVSIAEALGDKCYTFNRAPGEEDGSYWFRTVRTAGTLSPGWRVYGPTGAMECAGSDQTAYARCPLLASGQFILVVDDSNGPDTGSFFFTARRATSPTGCTALPSVAYGADPVAATLSTAGEADCLTIPGVQAGDNLDIRLSGDVRWDVIDGAGQDICISWYASSCALTGTPGWKLLVFDPVGTRTSAYSLTARRLNEPQGCTSLGAPAAWSFASGRISGAIGTLGAKCYTFDRAVGEEDGTYWLRTARTAGTLDPRWRVYGPTGALECSGSAGSGGYTPCRLLASGTFTVVVEDSGTSGSGSFFLTAKRSTSPTGCTALPSLSFTAESIAGGLSAAGEIDCYALPAVEEGDRLEIMRTTTRRWTVVDGAGQQICDGAYSETCTVSGSPGWHLLVYDDSGSGTGSYALAVHRLTAPEGCTSLGDPAIWSFTAQRLNGSVDSALGAKCYTFTRAVGEEDGAYWIRTARTTGTVSPRWRIVGPTGIEQCVGYPGASYSPCRLQAAGTYAMVVDGGGATDTGSFFVTAKRTTARSGCATLPSIAFGVNPIAGTLSTGGEIDCYNLPASSGDRLLFSSTGSVDELQVVDATGEVRCRYTGSECTIVGEAPYSLLLTSNTPTTTGSYRIEASCQNVPCGQSDTAVTDVVPNRVGPGSHTTVVLRGRDLELVKDVRLRRGETVITATTGEADAGGRATQAHFDLAAAALGKWQLEVTFLDGTTRVLSDAVTVEALRAPRVSAQLSGSDVFRAGRAMPVKVVVQNSGNVDAIGVPVVLSGIPAGSAIEPAFPLQGPQGSVDDPELVDTPFDQATDAYAYEGGVLAVPMLLPRVPAGGTIELEYRITAPAVGADYVLRAASGQCLDTVTTASTVSAALSMRAASDFKCYEQLAQTAISFVPFGDCFNAGYEAVQVVGRALFNPILSALGQSTEPVMTWNDVTSFGLSAAGCGLDATVVGGVGKRLIVAQRLVRDAGAFYDGTQIAGDCFLPQWEAMLQRRVVAAIDPNEIRGPAGSGEQRYIPGDLPLDYQVLFENLPAATAPAQRVAIVNQLDVGKLDPASVLFKDVRFGDTIFSLPYAAREIDDTIDLRPTQNLLVHVTASVSLGGKLTWILQAIDPETLAPPEDPLAGFLPPNATAPEGEGSVAYSVKPRTLPSGAVITNKASITFDDNPVIETPTWSNAIDRLAPTPTVGVAGRADQAVADVSWAGSDDAAGIASWELRVSKDGGPYTLWKTAGTASSAPFTATESGAYSFRAIARDGAGNLGQSTQAGINLVVADGATPPSKDPGTAPPTTPQTPAGGDGGGVQPPPALAVPAAPVAAASIQRPTIGGGAAVSVRASRTGTVKLGSRIACPGAGLACSVTTTAGPKKLGGSTFSIKSGGRAAVAFTLSGNARKQLTKRKKLVVQLVVRVVRGPVVVQRTIRVTVHVPKPTKRRSRA
jgi:hypothetical protein